MWCYISIDVKQAQSDIEKQEFADTTAAELEAESLLKIDEDKAKAYLTAYQINNSKKYTPAWWALLDHLITKYHDGYRLDDFHSETINPTALFYPINWLKQVGFFTQPIDWNQTEWKYTVDYPLVKPAKNNNNNNKNNNKKVNKIKQTLSLWDNGENDDNSNNNNNNNAADQLSNLQNVNNNQNANPYKTTTSNPAAVSKDGPSISYDQEEYSEVNGNNHIQSHSLGAGLIFLLTVTAIICIAIGIFIGQKLGNRSQYLPIN